MHDPYVQRPDGTWAPPAAISHRDRDYNPSGFASMRAMQATHFWYRGRHRFVLHFARQLARGFAARGRRPHAVDLGGGCGGWVSYLADHAGDAFDEIALADSSPTALALAADAIPSTSSRYQIDLLNLQWSDRWDIAFLLDVLEHIGEDERVVQQIAGALRPGGVLVIATPALEAFRSEVDNMTHHVRRYARADFERLARAASLDLVLTRYFMFFLSPLMWLARRNAPQAAGMTPTDIRRYLDRSDRVPAAPINTTLAAIFAAETPLGAVVPFPWGTSVLAVLRRPEA